MVLKSIWPPKYMACQALVMCLELAGKGQYLFNLHFDLLTYQKCIKIKTNYLDLPAYLSPLLATHTPPIHPPTHATNPLEILNSMLSKFDAN